MADATSTTGKPPDTVDAPLLGEPLPIEFANTRYVHAGHLTDYLGTDALIASWFAHAPAAAHLRVPARLDPDQAAALREVRDAVHRLLDASTRGGPDVDAEPVARLNHHAARALCRPQLVWDPAHGPRTRLVHTGAAFDVLVAQLAAECIALLAGPDLGLVRRCEGPDCPMFFLPRHRRRRFCHEGCASRARQTRYYHRHKASRRPTGTETLQENP